MSEGIPLSHDTYLNDPNGRWSASFGPRKNVGKDSVEECPPEEAQFWGVYRRSLEGLAEIVGDAHDPASAASFALMVSRDECRSRGFKEVPTGLPMSITRARSEPD